MLIANPISDSVFKWLLEDTRIARFFIETILEETVTEVELRPLEYKYDRMEDPKQIASALSTVMLDFVATIKTGTGIYKMELIEIQNARNAADIMRFRNYLAQHYLRKDEVHMDGSKKAMALPIVTIYLFGFNMPEVPTPVVKVSRVYTDQLTHQVIEGKNEFIEQLTHDCYVVQIPRIGVRVTNRLEQLLSFFEQRNFIDDTKMYKDYLYPIEDENIKLIADELHFASTDRKRRAMLDMEREAYRFLEVNIEAGKKELNKVIAEQQQELEALRQQIEAMKQKMDKDK